MDENRMEELVAPYFAYLDSDSPQTSEYLWAYLEIDETIDRDPFEAWESILTLVKNARNIQQLVNLGAGHLEDLIKEHGHILFDLIKTEATVNRRLQGALYITQITSKYEVFQKFQTLKAELKLDSEDVLNIVTSEEF